MSAYENSQNLSMALANRAFVWMKLEEYEKAQIDLLWIIKMGNYSNDNMYKIYQRLGIVFLVFPTMQLLVDKLLRKRGKPWQQ